MRLTASLLKIMPYRFRGKYRTVPEPKFKDLLALRHDLEREEKNMLYLRHPYLTKEQSHGHNKEAKVLRVKNLVKLGQDMKNAKYSKEITIEDRLSHFRVTEGWD